MTPRITGLYLITDKNIPGISHEKQAERTLKGGLRLLQLREKEMSKKDLLMVALNLRDLTRRWGARLIINDHVDIALACHADGVHIGQEDLPLRYAREILGKECIIGISTHNLEEALEAESSGADYISVGPIFPTETKRGGTPLGSKFIREVKTKVSIPVVAIGGINLTNIDEVIEAGADAIAIISAILSSGDITDSVRRFIEKIERRENK